VCGRRERDRQGRSGCCTLCVQRQRRQTQLNWRMQSFPLKKAAPERKQTERTQDSRELGRGKLFDGAVGCDAIGSRINIKDYGVAPKSPRETFPKSMRATTKHPVLLEPTGQHPCSLAKALEVLLEGWKKESRRGQAQWPPLRPSSRPECKLAKSKR
jgi:hypothetical protein